MSGKYRRGQTPVGSRLAENPGWMKDLPESIWAKIEIVNQLAADLDVTLAEYAIAWSLRHVEVSSVILGIRNSAQLESSIKGSQVQIPQEHIEKIDKLFPLAMDLRWSAGPPQIRDWQ